MASLYMLGEPEPRSRTARLTQSVILADRSVGVSTNNPQITFLTALTSRTPKGPLASSVPARTHRGAKDTLARR